MSVNWEDHLKTYFGFSGFKGNQQAIIESIAAGKDTFVIMPTGGGKSLCYQLPALVLDGTAIIVSPLIALMKNQVDAIRNVSNEESIAHFLNSSLTTNILRDKGIEATIKLSESNNSKVIVIGSGDSGLPIILGGNN